MSSPARGAAPGVRSVQNEIELYPLFAAVRLCDSGSCRGGAAALPQQFQQAVPLSRHRPVRDLLDDLCRGLGNASPRNARLWVTAASLALLRQSSSNEGADTNIGEGNLQDFILYPDSNLDEQLSEKGLSVDILASGSSLAKENNSGCTEGSPKLALILEVRDDKDSCWPRALRNDMKRRTGSGESGGEGETGTEETSAKDGNVGLYNMGKTGYLNASIQCLSHTPILREYFTSNAYMNDINKTNPLGQQGQLAQVTATLITEMWKRSSNQSNATSSTEVASNTDQYIPVQTPALTPKSFKEAIGQFNKHFDGNGHYDAQELLAFLLSALSEDLNLVNVNEPSSEPVESDSPDQEVADIWWSKHLEREMSIIKALFTGQYKSVLTCQTCNHSCTNFEPSAFLQLPIPQDENVSVPLVFYPLCHEQRQFDEALPTKYAVKVRRDGTLHDVLVSLSKLLCRERREKEKASRKREESPTPTAGSEKPNLLLTESVRENGDSASPEQSDDGTAKEADKQSSSACEEHEDKELHEQVAQNMAIVKMKNGCIVNIVPNKWDLSRIRSRETGDLELLHVYELDPLPTEEKTTACDDKENAVDSTSRFVECNESSQNIGSESAFIAVAQRKLDLAARPLFHAYSQRVFGTPLILRIRNLEECTGRKLYDLIAKRIWHLVPKPVRSFLLESSKAPLSEFTASTPQDAGLEAKQAAGTRQDRQRTTAENASSGQLPRYGFHLRLASRDGRNCSLCPWFECCLGCLLPDDDNRTILANGDSIALDWHMIVDLKSWGFEAMMPKAASSNNPDIALQHETWKRGCKRVLSLEECLGAFSEEEDITKAFCSHCNESRGHIRHLSCVKLPPILIVQLKRFQVVEETKQKLQDLVVFPFDDIDFSHILACRESFELHRLQGDKNGLGLKNILKAEETIRSRIWSNGSGSGANEASSDKNGLLEVAYDIYAIIHHQGAPSDGHFVASIKSELDGKWRIFNDAAIYQVDASNLIDSSAYILFYIRRDVKHSTLQDFWDIRPRESKEAAEEKTEKHQEVDGNSTQNKWFRRRHR